ncbi:hypothetical protein STCU_08907 [Strigomonas culicis]|nr:hypothetical protein STCU_08907 [Strigomonas culicis]|eukprot:EPY20632.1 hypothetical protein STCU_08907 [Strigomonas culicis]
MAVLNATMQHRPPCWLESKDVAIDGTPLTTADYRAQGGQHFSVRYERELTIGEAVAEVKRQKRFEEQHDVLSVFEGVRRFLGFAPPLDEGHARRTAEERFRLQEAARRWRDGQDEGAPPPEEEGERDGGHGVMRTREVECKDLSETWKGMLRSLEAGQPFARTAQAYRPRIDFYGIDPFLDSAPSLVWFSTKCGIAVGLVQGTIKTLQAVSVDVQFLKASGVGVLSILNTSVIASVIKWGGNTALLSIAFCCGDRLAAAVKRRTLPPHDAALRSTSNYVAGLSCAGATVGIMPWWLLRDGALAVRMAASGAIVGGALGIVVGLTFSRLVATNLDRLDASSRHLRRYEALMLRERAWAKQVLENEKKGARVWW